VRDLLTARACAVGSSSRYALDRAAGVATRVWQFRPAGVAQQGYGGWVQGLPSGNRLVMFNENHNGLSGGTAKVFEVTPPPPSNESADGGGGDGEASVVASIEVDWTNDAMYRVVAFESIHGEALL
jgi:hypothetical protein